MTATTPVTDTASIAATDVVTSTEATAEQVMGANPLTGVLWEWAAIIKAGDKHQSVVPDPASYTVVFNDDGTMAIKADCNNATGTYTLDNASLTITVGGVTRMACPPGSFGDTMLAALGKVTSYDIEEGNLVLRLGDGGNSMLFRNAGATEAAGAAAPAETPAATAPAETPAASQPTESAAIAPKLVGPTWLWEQFVDVATGKNSIDVKAPENYTVTFQEDGTAAMKADCNQAAGTYTVDGAQLTVEVGPVTLAACGANSLGETFLVDLTNVASYSIEDGRLMLDLAADGGRMVFSPK